MTEQNTEEHGYCILSTEDVSPDPVVMELIALAFQAGYDLGEQGATVTRQTVCFKDGSLQHWVATKGEFEPQLRDRIPSNMVNFDCDGVKVD